MSGSRSSGRRRCNDECIKRIAAHLCRLQECEKLEANQLDDQHKAPSSQQIIIDKLAPSSSCCSTKNLTASNDCSQQTSGCQRPKRDDCCVDRQSSKPFTCGSLEVVPASSTDKCGKPIPSDDTDTCCNEANSKINSSVCASDQCCSIDKSTALIATDLTTQNERCSLDITAFDATNESKAKDKACVDACCASDDLQDATSSCDLHLQNAFQRYEHLIRRAQCLCQRVIKDLGFCCCSPSKPIAACSTHAAASPVKPEVTKEFHEKCSQPVVKNEAITETVEIDLEAAPREHVVVNVAGMTCTGCVKKVNNVMKHISNVYNPVVTFVNETAEFDTTNAAAVIAQIEKETGFKLTRVNTEYQTLDVVMNKSVRNAYTMPPGVIDLDSTGKNQYRVVYNAAVIGARDLLKDGIALAPPSAESGAAASQERLNFMLTSFVISAVLTIPVLVLNWGNTSLSHTTKQRVSLPLATLVQAVAVPNFYQGALTSLIHSRVIEMDMLVVISITAAYLYSVVAFGLEETGIVLELGPFFETSTLLITLVILGRLITAVARMRAIATISVRSLQAEDAVLISGERIDARLLQYGDTIRVGPHSRIVTDGMVTAGESAVDESMLTGESVPVTKKPGDKVTAGTLNGSGLLELQLTRLPGSNSITDIANTVQDALVSKPKIQDLADKLASYFVPVVVALGLIVFLAWIGVTSRDGVSVGLSISYAIAVLAVSCPCALGLAVPMVLVIAGAISARNGVIIRAADALERGHRITDVIFDKTGTLTYPELRVVDQQTFGPLTKEQVLCLTKSLVKDNTHPVSAAVEKHLDVSTFDLTGVQSIPGCGIEAVWCGSVVRAGNSDWLDVESQDSTSLCVTIDGELAAIFKLSSVLRPESRRLVDELQRRGIDCHIVSGDAAKAVEMIAAEVGIENSRSRHTPAEKQKYVQELQKHGKVVFVGDGTNDAVAVAQADIGIQIGSASDVTDKVADVVLLGSLSGIVTMLDISRRCFHLICFNFAWSGIYNLFAILLASGAFVKFRLPPAYAGLGEIVSVLPVILAAATLSFWKAKH